MKILYFEFKRQGCARGQRTLGFNNINSHVTIFEIFMWQNIFFIYPFYKENCKGIRCVIYRFADCAK